MSDQSVADVSAIDGIHTNAGDRGIVNGQCIRVRIVQRQIQAAARADNRHVFDGNRAQSRHVEQVNVESDCRMISDDDGFQRDTVQRDIRQIDRDSISGGCTDRDPFDDQRIEDHGPAGHVRVVDFNPADGIREQRLVVRVNHQGCQQRPSLQRLRSQRPSCGSPDSPANCGQRAEVTSSSNEPCIQEHGGSTWISV